MDMKRFFLYAIVIVALTLAGCGGNGGGQTAMPDPTPTDPPAMVTCPDGSTAPSMDACPAGPTPEEMALKDAQDAAMAAYMMAMGYVGGAKDYIAMGNAQKYADMAKGASDMAAAATTAAMAEEYQMKAEMYRDQAMEAAMMRGLGITKLANMITNQTAIDNAILEGKEPPKPVSNAGRVGAALAASAAGTVTSTGTDDTGTAPNITVGGGGTYQGSDTTAGNNEASATATYTASGPTLTVTYGAGGGTVPADAVTRGETPTSLMTRGGWMGAELVGAAGGGTPADTSDDSKTYANVYTDIQAPTMTQDYGATADGSVTGVNGVALAVGQFITGDIPGDGSTFTGTRNVSATDSTPAQTGRFFCAVGTACSISVDEDGEIVALQGYGWQPIATTMSTNTDADYLTWGVWLRVPTVIPADGAAATTFAGAFASGNDVFQVYPQLKGKATYNGVANGLYSAAGMVEQFEADVMLEANFGGTDGADSLPLPGDAPTETTNDMLLLGVVTGMVSNINAAGMAVDGSLMLGRAPVTRGATTDASSNDGFTGDTSGTLAGRAMTGEWGGQFYGPNKATTDMARETEYPTTAAGTFGAASGGTGTDQVRILGAFGSWKAD